MMLKVILAVALSQYVRSRVDDKNPNSQCLWWPENQTIELRQSVDGNVENAGDAEFQAFAAAMGTWQTQLGSCASLALQEGTRTQTRKTGYFATGSNENIAVFRLRRCSAVVPANDPCLGEADDCGNQFDCWQHAQDAIAITTTSFKSETGRIIDSDIEFNSPAFIFTTVDSPVCPRGNYSTSCVATDVQNTTTHELGHLLGLAHTATTSSTMAKAADPGELSKRLLDSATAKYVCDVYPRGKPSRSCVLPQVSPDLGKTARGCQVSPGTLVFVAAAWAIRRRRRR